MNSTGHNILENLLDFWSRKGELEDVLVLW
jgi:hypothetical protein